MFKYKKLSSYKIKKIALHFCVDLDATKTSQLLGLNRKTVNRYFNVFRKAIAQQKILESGKEKQAIKQSPNKSFEAFSKKRLAKFYGVKTNKTLHLKENEWRFGKMQSQLFSELQEMIKII